MSKKINDLVIYKITNTVNDKAYVGQCRNSLTSRFNAHMKYKEGCQHKFHTAIQEIGAENFKIEVIEIVEKVEDLNEREIFWIKELDAVSNGYNYRKGGGVNVYYNSRIEVIEKATLNALLTTQAIDNLNTMCYEEDIPLDELLEIIIDSYSRQYFEMLEPMKRGLTLRLKMGLYTDPNKIPPSMTIAV